MTNLELALNTLAEATTAVISKKESPDEFDGSLDVARRGGGVAGNARRDIEKELGEDIVSSKSDKDIIGVRDDEIKNKLEMLE